ncbi:hypothetical protein H696_06133 [Fonticula alba]|uniref:Uncharacterized protein n=1 Tax=Fonticula alba TaxID=691883 RepID=A0A058Z0J4_FONAL|nr:hypothetical protein H696_06133 [Fonticula alba]KCV67438.1 hypothetical protein H696_06133 [Fonticula alba]|eukprot:XP_009498165.1 hypothetical protein H696_06133 [Fonticula alba]
MPPSSPTDLASARDMPSPPSADDAATSPSPGPDTRLATITLPDLFEALIDPGGTDDDDDDGGGLGPGHDATRPTAPRPGSARLLRGLGHPDHTFVVVLGPGVPASARLFHSAAESLVYSGRRPNNGVSARGRLIDDLIDVSSLDCPQRLGNLLRLTGALAQTVAAAAAADSQPCQTHRLLTSLQDEGALVHVCSQNIDGLEALVGLPPGRITYFNGTVDSLRCEACNAAFPTRDHLADLLVGRAPACPACPSHGSDPGAESTAGRSRLLPAIQLNDRSKDLSATVAKLVDAILASNPDVLIVGGVIFRKAHSRHLVRNLCKAMRQRGRLCVFIDHNKLHGEWIKRFDFHIKTDTDEAMHMIRLVREACSGRMAAAQPPAGQSAAPGPEARPAAGTPPAPTRRTPDPAEADPPAGMLAHPDNAHRHYAANALGCASDDDPGGTPPTSARRIPDPAGAGWMSVAIM